MKKILALSLIALCATAHISNAEVTVFNKNGAEIKAGVVLGMGGMFANNAQYGAGSADTRNESIRRKSPKWIEKYIKPSVTGTFDVGNGSTGYAGLSVIGAKNFGKGEPNIISTTSHEPGRFGLEDAYVGWKSGKLFKSADDLVDFSLGNQSFTIGDGFIICDGTTDGSGRGAYYIGPRTAFRETAILKINSSPVRLKFFHLQNNSNQQIMRGGDQPRTWLHGVDAEWFKPNQKEKDKDLWTFGASVIHVYKADQTVINPATASNRDGLMMYNARMGGHFIPWNHDIRFMSGVVHQENPNWSRETVANAYYIEPAYMFSKLWGKPLLAYRYSYYSGDNNPGSQVKRSYDGMLFGTNLYDGYGTYQAGDVFGQYVSGNSNLRIHQINAKFTPRENINFGVLYLNIDFDKPRQAGARNRHAVNEFNIYGGWSPYKWLELSTLLGMSIPQQGMKESIRTAVPNINPNLVGKTFYFGQLSAKVTF